MPEMTHQPKRNPQHRTLQGQVQRLTHAGFTFAELMITALLTGLLASAVIGSLISMMQVNQQVDEKVTRQQELNRSLDFIGDEVQRASKVEANITTPIGFPSAGNPVPILSLSIPNPASPGTPFTVIYYLRNSTGIWLGPRVLYRWGPPLNADGLYSTGQFKAEALMDLITDNLPNPNPNCQSDWLANPPVGDRQGAYTCVSPDGKLVDVVLRGKIQKAVGATNAIYEVDGQFNARSQ